MRHVAATRRGDKSRRHVAATSRLVFTAAATSRLRLVCRCDMSHKFKPVWICATDRNDNDFHMSHEAICCSNLSRRRVAAICRIVCLGLKTWLLNDKKHEKWKTEFQVETVNLRNYSFNSTAATISHIRLKQSVFILFAIHRHLSYRICVSLSCTLPPSLPL